ncbi:hypothetical protein Tco_1564598, partial [Tanacetum coccineum]
RGFLSSGGRERGVNEKDTHGTNEAAIKEAAIDGAVPSANVFTWINKGTQDENNGLNDVGNTVGQTPAGKTPGMSSYVNVASAPSRKALNFRTLLTRGRGEWD